MVSEVPVVKLQDWVYDDPVSVERCYTQCHVGRKTIHRAAVHHNLASSGSEPSKPSKAPSDFSRSIVYFDSREVSREDGVGSTSAG